MLLDGYKEPLIGAYCWATLPQRRREAARRSANGQSPIVALFYHRVADEVENDWTISTDRFQAQIEWLRARYRIVSLVDAQRRIASSKNDAPLATITFDDGYADNCLNAVPWLIDQGIPFTYFVSTRFVLQQTPFPHDVQCGEPLAPNTIEQLRDMAAAGVELGAHTRSHADLGQIDDPDLLHDEIVGSKRDLERIVDAPIRYFAFPFGLPQNLSEAAFRTAFRAGFWGVCSAYGGYNLPGDDSFHVQRIHGDPSWARFKNWMTIDPRKIRQHPFDAGEYRLCF